MWTFAINTLTEPCLRVIPQLLTSSSSYSSGYVKLRQGFLQRKRLGNCGVYLKSKVRKYKTRGTKQLWSACITINSKFCTTDSLPYIQRQGFVWNAATLHGVAFQKTVHWLPLLITQPDYPLKTRTGTIIYVSFQAVIHCQDFVIGRTARMNN